MADVITRLKVESEEYETKLKRATQQMQKMEAQVRKNGATFAIADKEELAFVRSLGKMQTSATTATGKLAEMNKAFVELNVQYKNLTKEERNSPFGKALQGSLTELKGRINELNGQVNDSKKELSGFSGLFDKLAGKIGIPTELLGKMGLSLAAVTGAIKVTSDALKQNEVVMDTFRGYVEGAKNAYSGFLYALNNGDISGFMSRIDDIVKLAVDAYDAIDALGTFNAFNQINLERARTEFTEAIANYRDGTGSKASVVAAANKYKGELGTRQGFEQSAYESKIRELASSRGVDAGLLMQALSGDYGDYNYLKSLGLSGVKRTTKTMANGELWETTTAVAANMQEKLGQVLRQLNDTELDSIQKLGLQAQRTATEIAQVDKQLVRYTGGSRSTSTSSTTSSISVNRGNDIQGGSLAYWKDYAQTIQNSMGGAMNADEYAEMASKLREVNALIAGIEGKTANYAEGSLADLNSQLKDAEEAINNLAIGSEEWAAALETLHAVQKKVADAQEQIKLKTDKSGKTEVDTAKDTATAWKSAAQAIISVGGAMQSIEDPSAKVAGIIAQAIASIALGYAEADADSAKGGWVTWLAFTLSGLATMISTISAVKQATGRAGGGFVPGTSTGGTDSTYMSLSPGELVLNKAQQGGLAAQLNEAGNGRVVRVEGRISGKDIILATENTRRAQGISARLG